MAFNRKEAKLSEQLIQVDRLKDEIRAFYYYYCAKIQAINANRLGCTIDEQVFLTSDSVKEDYKFAIILIQKNKYTSDYLLESGESDEPDALKKCCDILEQGIRNSKDIIDLFLTITPLADILKVIWLNLFWLLVSGANSTLLNFLLLDTELDTKEKEFLEFLYRSKNILKAIPYDNPCNTLKINPFNDFEIWRDLKIKVDSFTTIQKQFDTLAGGKYKKICEHCGKEFFTDRKVVKYCIDNNEKCRESAKTKRARNKKTLAETHDNSKIFKSYR